MAEVALIMPVARLARRYGHLNLAIVDQGVVSGSNVLTGILLARFLGVAGFGAYSLAWAVLLFIASIHQPLIVGSMMSVGPKQSDKEAPGYWGAVIVQNLAVAVFGAVVVFASAALSGWLMPSWNLEQLALPLGLATFATVWQEFFRRYFFTRGRPAGALTVDVVRYGSQIATLVCLFVLVPGVVNPAVALWIVAGAAALPALISLKFLGKIDYRAGVMRAIAARHYHASKWMVVSEPIEWASEYIFMFATGTLLGTTAVGALRATQNIAAMTNILFLSLMNVVPASAARHLHKAGMAAMNRYLRDVAVIGGLATIAVCIVLAAAPTFWLHLLFGDEFRPYGDLVRWWALYYAVNFFAMPLRSGLRAMEKTRPVMSARLMGACVAVATVGLFVPWLGVRGAVIGALTAKTVTSVRLWQLYVRYQREQPAEFEGRVPAAVHST